MPVGGGAPVRRGERKGPVSQGVPHTPVGAEVLARRDERRDPWCCVVVFLLFEPM